MKWTLGLAVYFVIWWTILFAILPFGVQSQHETGEVARGTDPGAPTRPHLLRRAIATSLVAGVLWLGFYWGYVNYYLPE